MAWAVSGLMCGSAYLFIPGSPLPLLAWVGLVPLLLRLASVQGFTRFYGEALAMLWVMEWMTLGRVFNIDLVYSAAVVTAQAFITSGVFVVLWWLRTGFGWHRALLTLPACWTAWEWLYAQQPLQIPTFLGATQADFFPIIQFYDVTGVWGGTFCIVLCNVLVALAIQRLAVQEAGIGTKVRAACVPIVCILVPPLAYSAWVFLSPQLGDPASAIRVAMVQTGAPTSGLATVTQAVQLSESILREKPDLLIWPETALQRDATSMDNRALWKSLYTWVAYHDQPVLSGFTDVEVNASDHAVGRSSGDAYFNAASLITPQFAHYALTAPPELAIDAEAYRKRILFPFGERVPFVDIFPELHPLVMHASDEPPRNFTAGDQAVVFAFLDRNNTKHWVGAFICYEILFPRVVADLVRSGAQVLTTVSNDVHLNEHARWVTAAHARIRAIETRRSVVRVNTVGYSLLVDPHGVLNSVIPPGRVGAWSGSVVLRADETIYVRWGDWLPKLCAAAVVLLVMVAATRRLQRA